MRTVGEFHYVHHQPDGTPYDERIELADAVIRAAKAEGLRIALLRVAYHRAGPGGRRAGSAPLLRSRASTTSLRDVDELRAKYKGDPAVKVGLAPHSVRAVPPSWLAPLADYARDHACRSICTSPSSAREIDECLAETKRRPMELFADHGAITSRFVAVHATHLLPHEAKLLGGARAFACICATTERDLGDGLPD